MKVMQAKGDLIDVTLGGTVTAGSVYRANDLVGIYQEDGVSGDVVPVALEGLFTVTKNANQVWAVGQTVYWNPTSSQFENASSTAWQRAGHAVEVAATTAATGVIRLAP